MSVKIILLFCAQVLLFQTISAQCIGAFNSYGYEALYGTAPLTAASLGSPWPGYGPAAFSASNGGGFATASSSPLFPSGVTVLSENVYEGALAVGGVLPFLGTVAIEGSLTSTGAGAIAYGCGSGAVRITAEDLGAVGFNGVAGPLGYGRGLAGPLGYGLDLAVNGYQPGDCGPAYC